MHDSPSSPRRSIAPAPPKQQPSKKVGAPKAKGAVRAKSGCYTCRIRRKKCDERPNAEGRCETCIRLRLQCLGFGQKRPEWLKENNNVTMFREKIKDFLAAQGMIKGHSGSNNRASDQEGMLVLVNDHGRSETSSPHSPALSIDSSEDRRHNGHTISSLRHDPHYSSISLPSQHSHPGYSSQPPTQFTSTLPPSYQQQIVFEEEEYTDPDQMQPSYYIETSLDQQSIAPFINPYQSGLVKHYLDHVLQRQYLLADTSIADFIIRTVQQNPAVRDAVCLLASLHQESLRHGHVALSDALAMQSDASSDYSRTYKRICASLSGSAAGGYTEGEAMAGLFVVSAFLFRGGRGAWQQFLSVAADWVWMMLHNGNDPGEIILNCTDSQQFIIKTTFWFDILASTTRLQPPRFLNVYRTLWSPRRSAYIEGTPAAPALSMLSVMGCENATALAIAEISALACWKEAHVRQGSLSVPELVDRGRNVENECLMLASPTQAHPPPGALYAPPGAPDGAGDTELAAKRRLTADIFRATARVYLHSVLSGEYPGCPEIRDGVQEIIQCLRRVPAGQSPVSRSVLRSVVFGICLCGCLTDDYAEREFLLKRLEEEQAEGVGNCAEARSVMEQVWSRRAGSGGSPISWRDAMQQFGGESLLLV
ncbi:fungal-specific transcription factor domain-containing protein [Gloeopeniophorella convolvens]|nr:fungal-specific transcription factor domain-containing protein [Gloeopeniophorella convolvens]